VKYLSTRGGGALRPFSDILLEGLAPDGGLYLPQAYPRVDAAQLARWRALSYPDLAFELLWLYVDDIAAPQLRALVNKTYTAQVFGDARITPIRPLEPGVFLQALSNGPTLAFKDIAMQLLGNLFEFELARRGAALNILGATSGDTGSAAEYALRGKRGVRVFMLSPHGRMSVFQQAQMFSLQDPNIHNIAIDGVFDDCQDIVKAVSADLEFKQRHHIGTVNSINWARLLAQVVYYFAGYFQATQGESEQVDFAVPSGNFGNICAGHIARSMGLPIGRLVLATNENNVLDEFFRTGTYRVRSAAETHETSSPSMDISKASNFERFIFDLVRRDPQRTRDLFGSQLAQQGKFTLEPEEFKRIGAFGFVSGSSTHADRLMTIAQTWARSKVLIDTHTADGLKVGRELARPGVPMIVLETALPAKFADTIREATGAEPDRPAHLRGIEQLPRRFKVMPVNAQGVKDYIAQNAQP
jgi:threonine synthase